MLGALRVYKTLAELIPPAHEVKAEVCVCVCVLPHIHTLVPQPSIHVQVHSDTLQRLLLSMPDLKPLVGHSLPRRLSQKLCSSHFVVQLDDAMAAFRPTALAGGGVKQRQRGGFRLRWAPKKGRGGAKDGDSPVSSTTLFNQRYEQRHFPALTKCRVSSNAHHACRELRHFQVPPTQLWLCGVRTTECDCSSASWVS